MSLSKFVNLHFSQCVFLVFISFSEYFESPFLSIKFVCPFVKKLETALTLKKCLFSSSFCWNCCSKLLRDETFEKTADATRVCHILLGAELHSWLWSWRYESIGRGVQKQRTILFSNTFPMRIQCCSNAFCPLIFVQKASMILAMLF